jgi:hypothetical protein
MDLTPPYDELAARFVLLHDPNRDVTSTHPLAIFRDRLAHPVSRPGNATISRFSSFVSTDTRKNPITRRPTPSKRPVMAAMQSARVRAAAGDRCVESEDNMRLRATSRYLHHNWFPFHRHAVILHRDQALSNCRK